jgi:hypothetical protein
MLIIHANLRNDKDLHDKTVISSFFSTALSPFIISNIFNIISYSLYMHYDT